MIDTIDMIQIATGSTASRLVRTSRALLVSAIAPRTAASNTTPITTSATSTSSSVNPAQPGSTVRDAANSVLVELDRDIHNAVGHLDPPPRLHPLAPDRQPQRRRVGAQQRLLQLAFARDRQPCQRPLPGAFVQQVVVAEQSTLAASFAEEPIALQVAFPGNRLRSEEHTSELQSPM